MFLDSRRMVFTFLSLLDLQGVVQMFWIYILKIFESLPNYLYTGSRISQALRKHFESSSGHTLSFYPNFVKYPFKNIFLNESLTQSSTVT